MRQARVQGPAYRLGAAARVRAGGGGGAAVAEGGWHGADMPRGRRPPSAWRKETPESITSLGAPETAGNACRFRKRQCPGKPTGVPASSSSMDSWATDNFRLRSDKPALMDSTRWSSCTPIIRRKPFRRFTMSSVRARARCVRPREGPKEGAPDRARRKAGPRPRSGNGLGVWARSRSRSGGRGPNLGASVDPRSER